MSANTPLAQQSCAACRGDEPSLTQPEIERMLPLVPEWQVVTVGNVPRLRRTFRFDDFAGALAFTQQVGELAEAQGPPPGAAHRVGQGARGLVDAQDQRPAQQ